MGGCSFFLAFLLSFLQIAAGLVVLGLGFGLVHQQLLKPFDFSHSYTDEGIA
jgi:hypothetical protein